MLFKAEMYELYFCNMNSRIICNYYDWYMSADTKGWILIYIIYYVDYCPLDKDEDNSLHANSVNNDNSSSQKFR